MLYNSNKLTFERAVEIGQNKNEKKANIEGIADTSDADIALK